MRTATLILLTSIASVIVLSIIFSVVWINRDTDKMGGILLKTVAAPLMLALVLLGSEMYSDLPDSEGEANLIFVRDGQFGIAPLSGRLLGAGSDLGSGYGVADRVMGLWLLVKDPKYHLVESVDEQREFTLDLATLTFLSWLAHRGPLHWDIESRRYESIVGLSRVGAVSRDAEKTPKIVRIREIPGLSDNKLLSHAANTFAPAMIESFALPSGSHIRVVNSSQERHIIIENRELRLEVTLTAGASGDLGSTDMAQAIYEAWPHVRWKEFAVGATFTCRYRHLRRWSPLTTRERQWITSMITDFRQDFDWSLLKGDLLRTLKSRPRI